MYSFASTKRNVFLFYRMATCYKVFPPNAEVDHLLRGGYWTNKTTVTLQNGLQVHWDKGNYQPHAWIANAVDNEAVETEDAYRICFLAACLNGKFVTYTDVDVCATELKQLMQRDEHINLKMPFRTAFPKKAFLPSVSLTQMYSFASTDRNVFLCFY